MGYKEAKSIYKQVCSAWKTEVVGFKELTGAEQSELEAFSSGVPQDFSAFERELYLPPPGWVNPGVVIIPPEHWVDDPVVTPLPAASWLFLGVVVICLLVFRKRLFPGFLGAK